MMGMDPIAIRREVSISALAAVLADVRNCWPKR